MPQYPPRHPSDNENRGPVPGAPPARGIPPPTAPAPPEFGAASSSIVDQRMGAGVPQYAVQTAPGVGGATQGYTTGGVPGQVGSTAGNAPQPPMAPGGPMRTSFPGGGFFPGTGAPGSGPRPGMDPGQRMGRFGGNAPFPVGGPRPGMPPTPSFRRPGGFGGEAQYDGRRLALLQRRAMVRPDGPKAPQRYEERY